MLSLKSVVYEVKQLITEEDIMAFNDFDDFVKTIAESYIEQRLKNYKYMEHIIRAIPVSNYMAVLPKYKHIIQIAGSDNLDLRVKPFNDFILNTEVAAYMKRDSQDNVYTVYKRKADCADDCETEIIMNANIFSDELAKGAHYSLIKKTYTDYDVDSKGYYKSCLDRNYYLMRPTESAWHGMIDSFIPNCVNFRLPVGNQTKYDFEIQYSRDHNSKIIKTNFKEGIILISYHGLWYDDEGWLMIPDNMPALFEAIKYYVQHGIFVKVANQYKTNDYNNRERTIWQYFTMFNRDAVNELNSYPYQELSLIIARAMFRNNNERTYEAILNRDHPDSFQEHINKLHDY